MIRTSRHHRFPRWIILGLVTAALIPSEFWSISSKSAAVYARPTPRVPKSSTSSSSRSSSSSPSTRRPRSTASTSHPPRPSAMGLLAQVATPNYSGKIRYSPRVQPQADANPIANGTMASTSVFGNNAYLRLWNQPVRSGVRGAVGDDGPSSSASSSSSSTAKIAPTDYGNFSQVIRSFEQVRGTSSASPPARISVVSNSPYSTIALPFPAVQGPGTVQAVAGSNHVVPRSRPRAASSAGSAPYDLLPSTAFKAEPAYSNVGLVFKNPNPLNSSSGSDYQPIPNNLDDSNGSVPRALSVPQASTAIRSVGNAVAGAPAKPPRDGKQRLLARTSNGNELGGRPPVPPPPIGFGSPPPNGVITLPKPPPPPTGLGNPPPVPPRPNALGNPPPVPPRPKTIGNPPPVPPRL